MSKTLLKEGKWSEYLYWIDTDEIFTLCSLKKMINKLTRKKKIIPSKNSKTQTYLCKRIPSELPRVTEQV